MRVQPLLVSLGVLLGILLGVSFSTWLVQILNPSDPPFSLSTALSSPVFPIKAIVALALFSGLFVSVSLHSWKILILANVSTILITATAEWIYTITEITSVHNKPRPSGRGRIARTA